MEVENLAKLKKYIGSCCGNSFIVVDCRNTALDKQQKADFSVENIRKYGVDSALFLENIEGFDIHIQIFEKDGSESDSCGNGIILIAYFLGLEKGKIKMKNSIVIVESDKEKEAISMNLKSSVIKKMDTEKNCLFVRMGEPHLVYLVNDLDKFNLIATGENQQKNYYKGVNVDAIQKVDELHYLIRTYERGVFGETKSCGTGSLSSYVAISKFDEKPYDSPIEFKSVGGIHWVSKNGNLLRLETLKKFCEIKILNELN